MKKNLLSTVMRGGQNTWQHKIICSKTDLKEWLNYERKGYASRLTFLDGLFHLTENDILWCYQKRLRRTEYYLNTNKPVRYTISRLLLLKKAAKYGIRIIINSCGKGLRISHIAPVTTNADIGENFKAYSYILLGENNDKTPKIGNNVRVCTGAVIVGDIVIADNITVGANAFVNKSFLEEGAVIAGTPARIVKK